MTIKRAGVGSYAFLPIGTLLVGAEIISPGIFGSAAVQHIWMAGAIGMMTLAVMTRAHLDILANRLQLGQRQWVSTQQC